MGATEVCRPQKRKKKDDPDYKYPGRQSSLPHMQWPPPQWSHPQAGVLKELATSKSEKAAKAKAQKAALNQIEEHNSCPISHALFVDPVMAEDGQIYERKSIEEWFNSPPHSKSRFAKSPVTQAQMDKKLKPVPLVRNTIETLINGDLLTGDAAEAWKATAAKIEKEKEHVKNVMERAATGHPWSLYQLGQIYEEGTYYGVKKDREKAFENYERSGWLGCRSGAVAALTLLQAGPTFYLASVPYWRSKMLALAHTAAALGSARACAQLALWSRDGTDFMPQCDNAATFWFHKVLAKVNSHTFDGELEDRQAANEWLAAHP